VAFLFAPAGFLYKDVSMLLMDLLKQSYPSKTRADLDEVAAAINSARAIEGGIDPMGRDVTTADVRDAMLANGVK